MIEAFDLEEPDDAVHAEVSGRFRDYNAERSGWTVQTFSLVRREAGEIVAGGRGLVYLGALEVRGLWVDPSLRGTGLGAALLTAIEAEGRGRGASRGMLYTYSWQAEGFYARHGWRPYGRFPFPEGHERIEMMKEL
ncbi:MAG: GNAT family N-acetyltransferase [Pseudomonadota bacterium]